ncbi:MAG: SMC family ATPase [Thermoplasmata archaeon]
MIIRSIALGNIRSYREAELRLPEGVVLFEGDIGSGKSTLLYAIELALFGLAEESTDFYLRSSEREGWVRLELELGGREYTFYRRFRRSGSGGGTVECRIRSDGAWTDYSAEEMKAEVLRLLGFNEPPSSKAKSVIYRYAVFTPQEEMKRILEMKKDERLQTIRRAFRVEEYRVARERARAAASELRIRSGELEAVRGELEGLRIELSAREEAVRRSSAELEELGRRIAMAADELRSLDSELEGLERLRARRDELEASAGRLGERVGQLQAWLSQASAELEAMREGARRLGELRPEAERAAELERRLEELEARLREARRAEAELARLRERLRSCEERIAALEGEEGRRRGLEERAEALRAEVAQMPSVESSLEGHTTEQARIQQRIRVLDEKLRELGEERRSLGELEGRGRCPRCGQELSPEHLKALLGELEGRSKELAEERMALAARLERREERLRACRERLRELEERFRELRGVEEALRELGRTIAERKRLVAEREELAERVRALEGGEDVARLEAEAEGLRAMRPRWQALRRELSVLEGRVAELSLREAVFETKKRELGSALEELGRVRQELEGLRARYSEELHREVRARREEALGRLGSLRATASERKRALEEARAELERGSRKLAEREARARELERLREAARWLNECFCPALESIEVHILAGINADFERHFRKWFGMLAEGTELDVSIDESFTPVATQAGYELDIRSLSGGEKNSVALAYRLALNHMVREVLGAGSGELLILDEPTDGFSSEQLTRVRDVLRELGARQLILVSHERELEGFADHIFRVVKENGESRVEGGGR